MPILVGDIGCEFFINRMSTKMANMLKLAHVITGKLLSQQIAMNYVTNE